MSATDDIDKRKRAFAERLALDASNGAPCVTFLLTGRRCASRSDHLCRLPGADHDVLWKRCGLTWGIQSQPYGISQDDLARTVDLVRAHQLGLLVDARDSWWLPGQTLSVIVYRPDINTELTHRGLVHEWP